MNPLAHGEDFVLLTRDVVPDNMGGWFETWLESAAFKCLMSFHNSVEAITAAQQGVTSVFTGTIDKAFPLQYRDVIKRVSDGEIFRVTSHPDDDKVPAIATAQIKEFSAEKFVLPR